MWQHVIIAFVVAAISGVMILLVAFLWRMLRTAFGAKLKQEDRSTS
jgi:uncharacterized membrane protein